MALPFAQTLNRITGDAARCVGRPCEWCGAPATHYCNGCGKCICNATDCDNKSKQFVKSQVARKMGLWS